MAPRPASSHPGTAGSGRPKPLVGARELAEHGQQRPLTVNQTAAASPLARSPNGIAATTPAEAMSVN
jgi:hypothetical protein